MFVSGGRRGCKMDRRAEDRCMRKTACSLATEKNVSWRLTGQVECWFWSHFRLLFRKDEPGRNCHLIICFYRLKAQSVTVTLTWNICLHILLLLFTPPLPETQTLSFFLGQKSNCLRSTDSSSPAVTANLTPSMVLLFKALKKYEAEILNEATVEWNQILHSSSSRRHLAKLPNINENSSAALFPLVSAEAKPLNPSLNTNGEFQQWTPCCAVKWQFWEPALKMTFGFAFWVLYLQMYLFVFKLLQGEWNQQWIVKNMHPTPQAHPQPPEQGSSEGWSRISLIKNLRWHVEVSQNTPSFKVLECAWNAERCGGSIAGERPLVAVRLWNGRWLEQPCCKGVALSQDCSSLDNQTETEKHLLGFVAFHVWRARLVFIHMSSAIS